MSQVLISSLLNPNDQLLIQSLNGSDVLFGTMGNDGKTDYALANKGDNSKFSSITNSRHLQKLLLEIKANASSFPAIYGLALKPKKDEKMNIVSFSTDKHNTYMSLIETRNELIGVQTWDADWQKTRETLPVIWLGYADETSKAAITLRHLYQECTYTIFNAWKNHPESGKWAQHEILTLDRIQKPIHRTAR